MSFVEVKQNYKYWKLEIKYLINNSLLLNQRTMVEVKQKKRNVEKRKENI